nr:MAG TPA_asm: hypothetical protein [Caudoviricetes sp.]
MQKAGHTARPAISLVLHGGFEPSTLGLEVSSNPVPWNR